MSPAAGAVPQQDGHSGTGNGREGQPPAGDHVVVVSYRPEPEGWYPEASYHSHAALGGDGSMSEENSRAAGESLAALLAGGEAGQLALIVPDSGEVLTYAQVAARVETLAQRLAGLGVRRGDRVALA